MWNLKGKRFLTVAFASLRHAMINIALDVILFLLKLWDLFELL